MSFLSNRILKQYRITEKSNILSSENNQYTFEVYPEASRYQVARAIEETFKVKVTKVNVLNTKPKKVRDRTRRNNFGTKSSIKKAIVSLAQGDKIELA